MEERKVETIDESLYNAFWNKLQQLRFDIYYYNGYFEHSISTAKKIKYGLIGSTALVTGAWMNWNSNSSVVMFCGVAIWILQAFSALSDNFPFKNRALELRELTFELEQLYINMETDFRKIQAFEISNEDILKLIEQYSREQLNITNHYFKNDVLSINKKIETQADNRTKMYFENWI